MNMMRECRMCSLDGNIQSEIVFEPLDLDTQDLENFFSDVPSKKILKVLTDNFPNNRLKAKLIVTDLGVVVLSRLEDVEKGRIAVFVKVLGGVTMAYEVFETNFRIYLLNGEDILSMELDLSSYECGKRFGVCWAAPLYVLLPKLYPEVCDNFACSGGWMA